MVRREEVPDPMPETRTIANLRLRTPGSPGPDQRIFDAFDALVADIRRIDPAFLERLRIDPARLEPARPTARVAASTDQRELAEQFVQEFCAWCGERVEEDGPVQAIFVRLKGNEPPESAVVSIQVGDRLLALAIPDPGSEGAMIGDGMFMTCSKRCAARLSAALREDRRLSIVH